MIDTERERAMDAVRLTLMGCQPDSEAARDLVAVLDQMLADLAAQATQGPRVGLLANFRHRVAVMASAAQRFDDPIADVLLDLLENLDRRPVLDPRATLSTEGETPGTDQP